MKKPLVLISLLFLISISSLYGQQKTIDFTVASKKENTSIIFSQSNDSLILWAVNDLAQDIQTITGKTPEMVTQMANKSETGIRISIGIYTDAIFQETHSTRFNKLENKWETFTIYAENNHLFIVGSDIRGTVYGIYHVAELLGISPWKWWADVPLPTKELLSIKLPTEGITQSPSVKYRGIFLNDEDWGLQPWAAKNFEPETGDIGPKTYEKIFQLLLRLKANTIWPAMHHCTKAFFSIPGNAEMAAKYHIVLGSSHAEPMLRNNVDEWDNAKYGDFNYFTNKENVQQYWQERLNQLNNADNEFIVTLGMRGIHDSGMQGSKNKEEQRKMVETIIQDQRTMLANTFDKPLETIPQVLIPYKEVLDLYNMGMQLDDDISIMWTDDNYGYIRRQNNTKEQQRAGGGGVYYHISYWGRPHDYLWLSTTQPGLIWYEMNRAYANGANNMWIVNVGDIKPAEYNMEFFLDMAWDINSTQEHTIHEHLLHWAAREFGEPVAESVANIMQEYYRLAFIRRPEFMGWSQTEPTRPTQRIGFKGNAIDTRINAYKHLVNKVEAVKQALPMELHDAFYQLVEYPVKGATLINYTYLYLEKAYKNKGAKQLEYLQLAEEAHAAIKTITDSYNNDIASGKWKGMMNSQPRGLPVFQRPQLDSSLFSTPKKKPSTNVVSINAADYRSCSAPDGVEWKPIPALGAGGNSVTLFPLSVKLFENDKPFLEYEVFVDVPGEYILQVRCLPTHSTHFDQSLSIRVNDDAEKHYPLNTKGRSEEWKENVLRNSKHIDHKFEAKQAGKQKVRISVNQTGIVLDRIVVYTSGENTPYEPTH